MYVSEWRPIEDLPDEVKSYANLDLQVLAQSWQERLNRLKESEKLREFNLRLSRQWAIETGIIERVYSLDRGITQLLIEKGIEASLIPHGTSNKPAVLVVSIIKDQKEVIDGLFDFVAQRRSLSTSYIKQMHQVFMRNQPTTEGLDRFGHFIEIEAIRGDWKKWPNNPSRSNGSTHLYSPPEQVASEMDRLIAMHSHHLQENVSPEVEAAWLHHRFTQIHPFQDGNGRIARALATLVFLRAGWFPLVIVDEIRDQYIAALEKADEGDLAPLIDLVAKRQIQAFRQALSISEEVFAQRSVDVAIQQGIERLRQRRDPGNALELSKELEDYTNSRLGEVSRELSKALQTVDGTYWASAARSNADTDYWFRGQIVQVAEPFGYYPDLRNYRAWLQLKIKEQRLGNLIVSFHGLGYEFTGIMAVSAFLEFRTGPETEDSLSEGPYTVCADIFQFSYRDDLDRVLARYKPWLEEVLLIGLEQWRKQL